MKPALAHSLEKETPDEKKTFAKQDGSNDMKHTLVFFLTCFFPVYLSRHLRPPQFHDCSKTSVALLTIVPCPALFCYKACKEVTRALK